MIISGIVPEHSTIVELANEEVIENLYADMTLSELYEVWPCDTEKEKLKDELNGN